MPTTVVNILLIIIIFVIALAFIFLFISSPISTGESTTDAQAKIASNCKAWIETKCSDTYYNNNLKTYCEKLYGEAQAKDRCKVFCGC
ncbi:MAG: hypothetical protein QXF15_01580 [Candidatus Aenigmatarchaeota archaeon]|nr:hypothetical protein [Candidatus Aenigmarchaeota archaeon]